MEKTQRMEQLSLAYVEAVAATAGLTTLIPRVDDDSIDMAIFSRSRTRPRVELQAKCTSRAAGGDEFPFQLSRKNYDDLRTTDLLVPRILVVVVVPEDIADWITIAVAEESTLLRCVAYWYSLRGLPNRNQESVTVRVLREQVLDPIAINNMMDRIKGGELP